MLNRIQLRDDIVTHFNEEELQQLTNRFGVAYQSLRGKTQRDRVGVLIGTLERQQRLPELVQEVVQERRLLSERYQPYLRGMLPPDPDADEKLQWLDRIAGGFEPLVEEQPTMSWKTRENKHDE